MNTFRLKFDSRSGLATNSIFFCFLFCKKWPLIGEILFSSVPPSNFLVFVSDPWRPFWADTSRFLTWNLTRTLSAWNLTRDQVWPLTQFFSVSFFVKNHWFAWRTNQWPLIGEILFSSVPPSNRLFVCQDNNENEPEDETFRSFWIKPVTNEPGPQY